MTDLADARGVAEQHRVCVADAADDFMVVFRHVGEQNDLVGITMQRLVRRGNQADRLDGNQFVKHAPVLPSIENDRRGEVAQQRHDAPACNRACA